MGKLTLPTVVRKSTNGVRRSVDRDAAAESQLPDDVKPTKTNAANINQPIKILPPVVQSDYRRTAPAASRATVSFSLPPNRGRGHALETTHGHTPPPSTPPPARSAMNTPNVGQGSSRPVSPLLRGRDLQHAIQDGYPSILECLLAAIGDAQASPFQKQSATDANPIDATARLVQEHGSSARAEALQVVGALLKRIHQQTIKKEEIRNVFYTVCTDIFARNLLDNVSEVSFAFQLLCVLVQEDIMQGSDLVKVAAMLAEESHYDSCKLLVKLVLDHDDGKLKLAGEDVEALIDIASCLKPNESKGKEKA